MKKIISLILITVFMLTALVSCAYSDDPFRDDYGFDTNALTNTTTQNDNDQLCGLPLWGLNFEGLELNILAGDTTRVSREWDKKEENRVEYSSAIQTRNKQVSDELNVKFKLTTVSNTTQNWDTWIEKFNAEILNDISLGQKYDMYSHTSHAAAYISIRGAQANMLDKEVFPYFDFTMPCWNQSIVDLQSSYGKLYYVAGALNLSLYDQTVVMWHNMSLYEMVKTSEDCDDIQELALDGNFTYDVLYRWANLVQDEGTGKKCDNTYGISDLEAVFYDAIPYAWGLKLVNKNADGTLSLNIDNNSKVDNALNDLRDLRAQKGVNNCVKNSKNCEVGMAGHFANGQSMFMPNTLRLSSEDDNNLVRDMQDWYVVLPMPKYSTDQKDYTTTAVGDFEIVSVLDHGENIKGEAVSAFLQRMTELSHNDVSKLYFRELITPRFFGQIDWSDPYMQPTIKAIDMLSDLTNYIVFDEVKLYGGALDGLAWDMRTMVEYREGGLADAILPPPNGANDSTWYDPEQLEKWEEALSGLDNYMRS